MSFHVQHLLLGGGVASSSAAAAIRELDQVGSIVIVGAEVVRPYNRPPLSKEFLRSPQPHSELFTQSTGWFAENQIELRTARRASHLDTARRMVTLNNGEEISFDKLLIATGGSPRHLEIPGAQLPNTFYLRSLEDADRLLHAMSKARVEGHRHEKGRG